MWSRKRSEAPLAAPAPLAGHDAGRELSAAWKSLTQTKAALRHIENRLEAAPGTGVLLDSVMDTKKTSSGSTRKVSRREGRHLEDTSITGTGSKSGSRSRRSPDKSSRSPLRTTTLDSNVRRANCVEFREPLASYRETTPPPLTSAQLEAQSLLSEVPSSPHVDPRLSQLVYQRDTRDQQTHDMDSTHSSALENTVVRYLNDRPALDALRRPDEATAASYLTREGTDSKGRTSAAETSAAAETTQSSSPGSTSQRLENLRRRQPDDKLEKLKERIRRQREHLEEAAERDRLLGYLQQPVGLGSAPDATAAAPTTKVRKVATAPPAPIYKGFNPTETKIRTPDGKVWREEEFHNLSREVYRDLSLQLAENAKSKRRPAEKGKEKKPSQPVRKVHKSAPAPAADTKPVAAVTSTSWREGQKPARTASRPAPRAPREPRAESKDRAARTGPAPRANSDPRPGSSRQSRASSTERPRSVGQSEEQTRASQPTPASAGPEEGEPKALNTDLLSADIRGILDDLQLEGEGEGEGEGQGPEESKPASSGARARSRGKTGVRVSRSASPAKVKQETAEPVPKKRHYDAESVRQYIARQQEERKKKQQEERRAQREEAERRNRRLQELYRKQREGMAKVQVANEGPAQKRLQETYTKLLLEQARLGGELPQALPTTEILQPKPVYQPSGESDKENKRLDRPQSASSSSDLSLSEPQVALLTRNDLGRGGPNWMQPDRLSPAGRVAGSLAPPAGHLFTQLLGLEPGISGLKRESQPPVLMGGSSRSKMNRIEALKATAASLSTRIENEARKLAGAGINYDCARDAGDAVTGPPPQPHESNRWATPVSPPVHEASEADDLALRIQRLLSAGHTTYNGVLPGVGNLHSFRNLKEEATEPGRSQSATAAAGLGSRNHTEERQGARVVVNASEAGKKANAHDSSGDSISEGPLLSEGSLSEGDGSPQASAKALPKPAAHLRAQDFCAGEQDTFRHISQFQKEAEKYPAFSPVSQAPGSRGPWEELAKGSPHSVINIFTKNLNNYSKVVEEKTDRSSPALRSALLTSPMDVGAYEDDFVSSSSNGGSRHSVNRGHVGLSLVNGPLDELVNRRSPYDIRAGDSPSLPSSGSTPASSPRSAGSVRKRASEASADSLELTLVERHKSPSSQASEALSRDSQRDAVLKGSDPDRHSPPSLVSDGRRSPRSPGLSPSGSPPSSASQKASVPAGEPSPTEALRTASSAGERSPPEAPRTPSTQPSALPSSASSSSSARVRPAAAPSVFTKLGSTGGSEAKPIGELQYAPSALQQRMAAELSYLDAMEESVRQLADVERLRGVSLAQQESVSLAQILKSQQQRHERDLFLLKQKAEQEALETKRQLEETRQRAARAHAELQESMVQSQQESLGGLQDAANRMISQQAEAVRYTADAARHIKEMTELARSQIAGALSVPAAPITALFDQQRQHHQSFMKQLQSSASADSRKTEGSVKTEEPLSSLGSPSESSPSRGAAVSRSSSVQTRSSLPSSEQEAAGAPVRKDKSSSWVEDEAHTAADDSVHSGSAPSLLDDKDNTSVATEYSLKFEGSMTEDEIEEHSFRSLLPSESHRRSSLKGSSHEDSEEERSQEKSSVPESTKQQESSMAFSSGQHSFSRFTMDMVRQYMKEEEVRAQHQSSLLRLREKALKEKTKAELAWLEHQKRRLRDKGEDDKMPPIRKKQRGLLLRLQQEQAEIKRLQEANRAARKERLLLLKQQEEIERMRHTTLKLKERLKSAGESNAASAVSTEAPVSEPADEAAVPSPALTDLDTPSPSPMSVSGSETSSIMQKLKKMRSHMDEKFLTKREQQLMQRRRHAEELLEWKQRLDAEEAEVRRMEKQALAAWDGERHRDKPHRTESPSAGASASSPADRTERELGSKSDYSPVATVSSQHTEHSVPEELGSLSTDHPVSELPSPHKDSSQLEDTIYTQEFDSSSETKQSPSPKASLSTSRHPESSRGGGSSGSKPQLRSSSRPSEPWSNEARSVSQSEPTSDQSDIESRIHALKEELRKRKSIVYQLKKEQKKRQKERLKAQEASLLKQLESYNDFIQKTKAELSKEPDTTPTTKPQIKTPTSATEKPRIKPPPLQRPETSKSWKIATETEKGEKVQPDSPSEHGDLTPSGQSRFSSLREEGSSDEDPPTVTPTPVQGSPEHASGLKSLMSPELLPEYLSKDVEAQDGPAKPQAGDSGDESVISSQRSEVVEELELLKSEESDNSLHHQSDPPLLDLELRPLSQQHSVKDSQSVENESGTLREEGIGTRGRNKLEDSVDGREENRSGETLNNESVSATKEPNEHKSPEISSSKRDVSYTPDFDIPSPDRQEALAKLKEDSGPSRYSYHDDFESSVELSLRDGHHGSKPASPVALQTEARPTTRSPIYSSEEEISEVLSEKSNDANGSFCSEKALDLNTHSKVFIGREEYDKDKDKDEGVCPGKSPVNSRPQSPPSLTLDVMPDFNIGDRVLVSNVQPGTLRFKGQTSFANGYWAGVELDKSEGSNNGTYDGVMYFECEEGHGIFAPPDKISRLPEKFEIYVDTTEDEDSFYDDQSDSDFKKKVVLEKQLKPSNLQDQKEEKSVRGNHSGEKGPTDASEPLDGQPSNQIPPERDNFLKSTARVEFNDLESKSSEKLNGDKHPTPNGRSRNIILDFEDAADADYGLLITEVGKGTREQTVEKKASTPLLDLLAREKNSLEAQQKSSVLDLSSEEQAVEKSDAEKTSERGNIGALAERLLNSFVKDAVTQFQQIKKARDEKILASNETLGNHSHEEETSPESLHTMQRDGLPIFSEEEQEEVSSPELCPRPESPVLGASGQEELAKRLAELELSRELLDVLGDEPDWFDEDFGLSSRKEQQKQRKQLHKEGVSASVCIGGEDQVKTPVRPAPPQQAKVTEEPVMIVPHTASEVERLVHAATQEIWKLYNLGQGLQTLSGVPPPLAPDDFLGSDTLGQDQESISIRSYRKAVFDLTWEIIQEIFAEDPNMHQPQWMKPRRMNPSCFRRVKCPADMSKIQAFITTEVLKWYGLKKDQNQKTDWQKMLKFGRKKRDRVDHILVQELHEEESQWVNYDEDELFVKMQLADGIFDALVKDTADVLTQIQEKRAKRALS